MKNIVIGQYIPGEGIFYKIDPRSKIIAVMILMIAIFLLETIFQLMVAFIITLLIMIIGKIPLIRVIRGMKPLIILLLFTFFFQIFFNKEEKILFELKLYFSLSSVLLVLLLTIIWRVIARFGKFKTLLLFAYLAALLAILHYFPYGFQLGTYQLDIYDKGIEMSVFVIIRLLVIISLSTILTLTTKPTDLTQGLESLMKPLKVIGIKSEDFALIISISLRYIPTILDEATKIMAAQASRGSDFSQGKIKDKIKQLISLLVPMFVIAFKRSEELADAMESRNFVPGKPRTRIHELKFGVLDVFVALFTALCLFASIFIKVI